MNITKLVAAAGFLSLGLQAQNVQLAAWDFENTNTTPTLATGVASASIAAGGSLQQANNLTNSFIVSGLSATTLAFAKNGNGTTAAQYISFTISPSVNYALDIANVAIQGYSQNINRTFNLSYIHPTTGVLTNVQNQTINTPTQTRTFSISSLTGVLTPLEFRIYIFSNPTGQYDVAGFGEADGLDLVINGRATNMTAQVTPGTWSLQGNTVAGTQFLGSVNNESVKIYTNNTEKVRITTDGNVGIGTTNPTEKLAVVGKIALSGTNSGLLFADGTATNSWQPVLSTTSALAVLNNSVSGLKAIVATQNQALLNSILGLNANIATQATANQATNQAFTNSILGINSNVNNTKTDVANLQTALSQVATNLNNGITFTGSKFDIYTPVQGQYNGGKPIMSMTQFGQLEINSNPVLNYNTIYLKNGTDFNNGIRHGNGFGTASGFEGPVVFGQNGGALGSSTANSNWNTTGTNVALSWDAAQHVKIHKALQFADGSVQTSAGQNVNYNPTSNYYTYQGNSNITGTLKIGTSSMILNGKNANPTQGTAAINEIFSSSAADPLYINKSVQANTIINETGGNVGIGIGTIAPNVKLQVDGRVKATAFVLNDGFIISSQTDLSYASGFRSITINEVELIPSESYIATGTEANFPSFNNRCMFAGGITKQNFNGSNRMTYTCTKAVPSQEAIVQLYSESKVGLGTYGPTEKLDVVGNIKASGNVIANNEINAKKAVMSNLIGTGSRMLIANANGTISTQDEANPGITKIFGSLDLGTRTPANNDAKIFVSGNIDITGEIRTKGLVTNSFLDIRNESGPNKIWRLEYDENGKYFYIDELGTARHFKIKDGGNVGIGVANIADINQRLVVDGNVRVKGEIYSKKNVVTQIGWWADDEFDLQSPTLAEEEATAKAEKHLIGVPTECQIQESGLDLGNMQAIQMRKIEQLFKHLWKMDTENQALKKEVENLKNKIK